MNAHLHFNKNNISTETCGSLLPIKVIQFDPVKLEVISDKKQIVDKCPFPVEVSYVYNPYIPKC
jgi:hypothetical protein